MRLTKLYNKNYNEFNDNFQLILPLNLKNLIPEDDSVRLLNHVLEGLDYRKLYKTYSSVVRKPAVEPKIMFKIIAYAYSQNIYSSRKIEKSFKRDINFRWLLQGCKTPDHATISRFRKNYLSINAIEDLFYEQVKYLADQNEILFENVFIDGTKIEANANRYTFVWKKVILKNEEKMFDKIIALLHTINLEELKEFAVEEEILILMISNMQEKIGHNYRNVIADSGYESEENYLFLESNNQIPYIKPQIYEKWKKRSFKNDISKRENMKYDAESDKYICHNDKKLVPTSIIHRKFVSGYNINKLHSKIQNE